MLFARKQNFAPTTDRNGPAWSKVRRLCSRQFHSGRTNAHRSCTSFKTSDSTHVQPRRKPPFHFLKPPPVTVLLRAQDFMPLIHVHTVTSAPPQVDSRKSALALKVLLPPSSGGLWSPKFADQENAVASRPNQSHADYKRAAPAAAGNYGFQTQPIRLSKRCPWLQSNPVFPAPPVQFAPFLHALLKCGK